VQRSDAAGWAAYGYCASHSRFFWGLRLYLICTPTGMPILWALADAKIGEREIMDRDVHVVATVHVHQHPVTDALLRRADVEVFQVTEDNRDEMPTRLLARLVTSWSCGPVARSLFQIRLRSARGFEVTIQ
jgi:hypothetical protein